MKKIITILLLLISVSISFSQSKKQQIEILTHKLDSINSVLLRSIDDNEKLIDKKLVLESKVSSLKKENTSKESKISSFINEVGSKNEEIESLKFYNQSLSTQLDLKSDSVEIFRLKKERISEVNSYYLKVVEDYLMGATNCLTKTLSGEDNFSEVKKCQWEVGYSYKMIEERSIEGGTFRTQYFYKNNICFFVNRYWGSEGVSGFERVYYDRKGEIIQVLSTQLNQADFEYFCYFYTEVTEKEKIDSIIDGISSSEKELNRIFKDK
jgi:hypothetical protein